MAGDAAVAAAAANLVAHTRFTLVNQASFSRCDGCRRRPGERTLDVMAEDAGRKTLDPLQSRCDTGDAAVAAAAANTLGCGGG